MVNHKAPSWMANLSSRFELQLNLESSGNTQER